jgi:hypothetical protein
VATLVGEAGEHFVPAELLRCGWIAGQTPRGFRSYDLMAYRRNGLQPLLVGVKTATDGMFQWSARCRGERLEIFHDLDVHSERDPTVLVWMPEREFSAPTYYLYRTSVLEPLLQRVHAEYHRAHAVEPWTETRVGIKPRQLDGARDWTLIG